MRSLNLDHLRALTEVLAQESFTAAAKRLNLSQPAVSLQIRELENRLGVKLVDRLGKRAFATAAGRELAEHARRLAVESEQAQAAMRRYREGWLGRVRIGASTTALIYHLPPVLAKIRRAHGNIELVVTTGTTTGVVERMMDNEIDLGVVSLPVNERFIDVVPLRSERLVAIFPATARNIPDVVTPEYLVRQTLILEYARAHVKALIVNWLTVEGIAPRPAMELDNLEAVKRMVAVGLGVSILPSAAVAKSENGTRLLVRPIAPDVQRTLALVQRRDKPQDPALAFVRDAILTLVEPADGRSHTSKNRPSIKRAAKARDRDRHGDGNQRRQP